MNDLKKIAESHMRGIDFLNDAVQQELDDNLEHMRDQEVDKLERIRREVIEEYKDNPQS